MTKTYSITPEKAAAAALELKTATGISIDPNQPTGTVVVHGVHLAWTRTATHLTVNIVGKPFYVPESSIWGPMDKAFG